MDFPWSEIIRIAAAPVATLGPIGALGAPAMLALANSFDKEDEPDTPKEIRKMREDRRKKWIEYRLDVEHDNLKKLKQFPELARASVKRAFDEAASRNLAAVMKGDIYDTENRFADDMEIRVLADAVGARVQAKL